MKRWQAALWAVVASMVIVCGSLERAAAAGVMFAWAEQAETFTGGCTRDDSGQGFTVQCDDASGSFILSGIPFPPGASNTWQYQIQYSTADVVNGAGVCGWDVNATARPNLGAQSVWGSAISVDSPDQVTVLSQLYDSNTSSALAVFNAATNAACTGSPSNCENADVTLRFTVDTTATTVESGICFFRKVKIIFN